MPKRCCVPKCRSNYEDSKKYEHITTFNFPKNEKLKKQWLLAIGRKKFVAKKHHGVCIKHFRPIDILQWNMSNGREVISSPRKIPKLRDDNIGPCIFNFTSNIDKDDDDSNTGAIEPIPVSDKTEMKLENELINSSSTTTNSATKKDCRLCLDHEFIESIEIFSDKGQSLNIATIISQHFWFNVSKFLIPS